MNIPGPIALIGPMAVGKTAIGQQLAKQLRAPFVDTDALIVENHGSIADIFAGRGEHAFREIEARIVARVIEDATGTPTVISLGGGAVLDSGTQQLLAGCMVVYLECDPETVWERISRNSGRPLLAGDPMNRWMELFTTRRPVYERLADLVFDVRHGSVSELGRRLEEALRDFPGGSAGHAKKTASAPAGSENAAVSEIAAENAAENAGASENVAVKEEVEQ